MTARASWQPATPRALADDERDPLRAARGILNGLLLSAVLWALLFLGVRACYGQVEPRVTVRRSVITSTVVENAERDTVTVSVTTWRALTDTTPVRALITPRAFTLAPAEAQVVRLRLDEPCAEGWRLVTLLTPRASVALARAQTATARVTLQTRIVGKLLCAP